MATEMHLLVGWLNVLEIIDDWDVELKGVHDSI